MEIIDFKLEKKYEFPDVIATIGAFDGLHLGHNQLFKSMELNSRGQKKMVITFASHPDYILNKRRNTGFLCSFDIKKEYFINKKIDFLVVLPLKILNLAYDDFNKKVLKKLNVKTIVVGNDFVYGKNALGNIGTLNNDFKVFVCDLVYQNGQKVSSQSIRECLERGQVETIKGILGTNYFVVGTVEKGAGLGHKFGFPTANLKVDYECHYMLEGVYACYVYVGKNKYLGVANVGKNPTINTQKFPRIEAFIIDFSQEIYGEKVKIEFLKMIRKEKKFTSIEELITEISKNVEEVKKGFKI